VHPDFGGRGIAQGFLQHIEAKCRAIGLDALELNASYNAEGF
jgi:N-acetylglutamate synthase-like GNAT family acetyltransferase